MICLVFIRYHLDLESVSIWAIKNDGCDAHLGMQAARLLFVYHVTCPVNSASNVQGTQPWNTGDLSKNNWWGWSIVPLFAFLQFILQKPSSLSVIIFSPARWDVTCSLLFYLVANLKQSLVWWLEDIITCIWLDVHFPPYVVTLIFRWVALISFGEEWHNNHHAFEYSPHHGLKRWQLDMTWCAILRGHGPCDQSKVF
jgi:hypothetical protein